MIKYLIIGVVVSLLACNNPSPSSHLTTGSLGVDTAAICRHFQARVPHHQIHLTYQSTTHDQLDHIQSQKLFDWLRHFQEHPIIAQMGKQEREEHLIFHLVCYCNNQVSEQTCSKRLSRLNTFLKRVLGYDSNNIARYKTLPEVQWQQTDSLQLSISINRLLLNYNDFK